MTFSPTDKHPECLVYLRAVDSVKLRVREVRPAVLDEFARRRGGQLASLEIEPGLFKRGKLVVRGLRVALWERLES